MQKISFNGNFEEVSKMNDQKISEPLGYYIGRDRQPGLVNTNFAH